MTTAEKIEILADILEVEPEELTEETRLEEIETWDSVAVLSFISVMGESFNKYPLAGEIRGYETIGDLMEAMKE